MPPLTRPVPRPAAPRSVAARRATAPTPPADDRAKQLVRSVLDVVPLDVAIEVFLDAARASGRADAMLAAATLRGERSKPLIEARSGPSESTEETGKRLGKSGETIRSWIERGQLVGYRAPADPTRIRLPLWQFDDQGVRPWVRPLIDAYGNNGWGLVAFLTVPRAKPAGAPYLHRLLSGRDAEIDAVLTLARRANPD
jgi:hypothetical protein